MWMYMKSHEHVEYNDTKRINFQKKSEFIFSVSFIHFYILKIAVILLMFIMYNVAF